MTPRTTALAIAGSALALGAAWSAGRYTAPTKVKVETVTKTETAIEYRDRIVERRVAGPVRIVTRTEPARPAEGQPCTGTVTTVVEERGPVAEERQSAPELATVSRAESQARSVTTLEAPRWLVGASAGTGGHLPLTYGGHVLWRAAGPFWLGLHADSEPSFRLSLSLTF